MKPFAYTSPSSLDEVLGALDGDGATRPLAGGTDLLTLMKADLVAPERLVDLKRAGLPSAIEDGPEGLVIGALATLADVETSEAVRRRHPALAQAAAVAATPQLRNMATVGGNLLQRPRCWYFRHPHLRCWLEGGDDCLAREGLNHQHAILGESPCRAAHPSDLAPALVALDARVRLRGREGERTVPVGALFAEPTAERRTETRLGGDELILALQVPAAGPGTRSTYRKAMDRRVWSFALASVAACVRLEGRRIAEARLVLGGVAPVPWRAVDAERELTGAEASRALLERAAAAAVASAAPLRDNGYKVGLAQALVRQALESLVGP